MTQKAWARGAVVALAGLLLAFTGSRADDKYEKASGAKAPAEKKADVKECYELPRTRHEAPHHGQAREGQLRRAATPGLHKHVDNPGPRPGPTTDISWEACGACHKDAVRELPPDGQPPSGARREEPAHGPLAESVLGQADDGPRLHEGAQPDPQPLLDAGRTSSWWTAPSAAASSRRTAGSTSPRRGKRLGLPDRHAPRDATEHKAFIRQTAAAANPVCLQCKTQDKILEVGLPGRSRRAGRDVVARLQRRRRWPRPIQHGAELLHLPRPARGQAPHRARRPDPGAHPPRGGHALAQGREAHEDRGHRHGRARLPAQDRPPREVRLAPPVRPVPRRVQLQPGHEPARPARRSKMDGRRARTTSPTRTSSASTTTT